jgi:hypothetical protein
MRRLLLCTALILWSSLASAVVYKWTDAQGKVQYGDRPPDGVHAEIVELLGTHSGRVAASSATAGTHAPIAAPSGVTQQEKKSVAQDVESARAKQCADAQDRYKKLIEGRRLYKTGDDGEKEYLTSEQIDTERLNAKRDVDTVCTPAS